LDGVTGGAGGHYHVATPESLGELIQALNDSALLSWTQVAVEAIDSKVGNGFTLVYRKD
jgi:hypothetical protein